MARENKILIISKEEMTTKINLHELMRIKRERDLRNLKVFNHILELCHRKIKHIAEHGGMSLYYNIPPIIIGYPLYDHKNCIEYISKELRKSGLFIGTLPPPNNSYIYISWKLDEINPKSRSKLLLE